MIFLRCVLISFICCASETFACDEKIRLSVAAKRIPAWASLSSTTGSRERKYSSAKPSDQRIKWWYIYTYIDGNKMTPRNRSSDRWSSTKAITCHIALLWHVCFVWHDQNNGYGSLPNCKVELAICKINNIHTDNAALLNWIVEEILRVYPSPLSFVSPVIQIIYASLPCVMKLKTWEICSHKYSQYIQLSAFRIDKQNFSQVLTSLHTHIQKKKNHLNS